MHLKKASVHFGQITIGIVLHFAFFDSNCGRGEVGKGSLGRKKGFKGARGTGQRGGGSGYRVVSLRERNYNHL